MSRLYCEFTLKNEKNDYRAKWKSRDIICTHKYYIFDEICPSSISDEEESGERTGYSHRHPLRRSYYRLLFATAWPVWVTSAACHRLLKRLQRFVGISWQIVRIPPCLGFSHVRGCIPGAAKVSTNIQGLIYNYYCFVCFWGDNNCGVYIAAPRPTPALPTLRCSHILLAATIHRSCCYDPYVRSFGS